MRKTQRHKVEIDGAAVICARTREEGMMSETNRPETERERERRRVAWKHYWRA
jgi:hypothetical protein